MTTMNENEMMGAPSKPIKLKKSAPQPPKLAKIDKLKHCHRTNAGRTKSYSPGCYACVNEDRNREAVSEADLAITVFLYPGHMNPATGDLCERYLAERYPGYSLHKGDKIPLRTLASCQEYQVVCVRPVPDVGQLPLPVETTEKDLQTNKIISKAVPRAERLVQICESAPIRIEDTCRLVAGSYGNIMLSGDYDYSELTARICESFTNFKVYLPARSSDPLADDKDGYLVVGAQ